ncbi:MAG: KpsF/GutQ family sugar-phosphate isomerase [Myxococcales bacterium]
MSLLEIARDQGFARAEDTHVGLMDRVAEEARETFLQQAEAIAAMAQRVDRSFGRAVSLLYATPGHVITMGMGKSGHVARKIAATLASTGTPSFFVHPAEAFHGDLGMVTDRDTVLVFSYSGETEEVLRLLPHLKRAGVSVVALVGCTESTLARAAHVALDVSVEREVCPNNLAPTNSTLAALAMGDALSVALMRAKQFGAEDFARFHPGGALGKRLLTRVCDVMHRGSLPLVRLDTTVRESLFTITRGRLGLALVIKGKSLQGIVTDGDLRRSMQKHEDVLDLPVQAVMSPNPVCISEHALLSEAEELMRQRKLKALVVVDGAGRPVGIVEIFQR